MSRKHRQHRIRQLQKRQRRRRFRPELIQVETRLLLSTFVVTSLSDSGPGSLRDILGQVNADPTTNGPDTISFDPSIVGSTITLSTPLEPLTRDDVSISGPITLDGNDLQGNGLDIYGNYDTVIGLGIQNFDGLGMSINGNDALVSQCIVTGIVGDGIDVQGAGNMIGSGSAAGVGPNFGGNLISGNSRDGVNITGHGATQNVVSGNLIGTNADGFSAAGNGGAGVAIDGGASNNTVGGATADDRNVISGNVGDGTNISDSGTSDNLVSANDIGTSAEGLDAIPNGLQGVAVVFGANGNVIGVSLTTPSAGNVISGNGNGVVLGFGAVDNAVAGNSIGLKSDGSDALPNSGDGVQIISNADNNTIGGADPALRNIISGNGLHGVEINGSNDNTVAANYIGTLADGETPLANAQNGIDVEDSTGNSIGLAVDGGGNVISGNGVFGIEIDGSSNNLMVNNTIGMTADLSDALGNGVNGINIENGSTANTIGGTGIDMGNRVVCTDPGFAAIAIGNTGDGSNGNLIQGNTIGVNGDGTYSLGVGNGIYIGSDHNTVGGTTAGARNYVVARGRVYGDLAELIRLVR